MSSCLRISAKSIVVVVPAIVRVVTPDCRIASSSAIFAEWSAMVHIEPADPESLQMGYYDWQYIPNYNSIVGRVNRFFDRQPEKDDL